MVKVALDIPLDSPDVRLRVSSREINILIPSESNPFTALNGKNKPSVAKVVGLLEDMCSLHLLPLSFRENNANLVILRVDMSFVFAGTYHSDEPRMVKELGKTIKEELEKQNLVVSILFD